jgi:hypothetical protein
MGTDLHTQESAVESGSRQGRIGVSVWFVMARDLLCPFLIRVRSVGCLSVVVVFSFVYPHPTFVRCLYGYLTYLGLGWFGLTG